MKALFAVPFLLVLSATTAGSQTIEWQGAACLTTVSGSCASEGWAVGNCLHVRFTPPDVGTNGPSTRFSFSDMGFAENYTLPSGSLIGTLQNVNGTIIGRGASTFSSKMKFASQSPAAPTAATNFITIIGIINDFDGTSGCNVGFRAGTARRP